MNYPKKTIDLPKLVSGDKEAWDDFVTAYSPVVFSAAAKVVHSHAPSANSLDLEEIVQDIFLKLIDKDYELLKSYDARKASMVTWLTVITRNATVDGLRKRRLESASWEGEIHDVAAESEPLAAAELPALPDGLLTGRQQLVLHLIFDKSLDISEIARILGVDDQTVRSTKHKALERLREHFSKNKNKFMGIF